MASIKRRGKTWGYAISHTVDGKTKLIRKGGFRTKKEADAAATEIESQLNKGIMPHLKIVPIDEYFDEWVKRYKDHLSMATLRHYKYTSERIKEFFHSKPLQKINSDDYQDFLNQLGSNKSKETVEKVNGHIRSCIKRAIINKIISADFTSDAVLKYTVPAKKKEEKHLNFNDSELLLKELLKRLNNDKGYFLLLLGLVTGLRFEELVGLTFNDFNFETNTIKVDKTWGYNNRMPKGFGPTKNAASNRTITLNEKTMTLAKMFFETLPDNSNHLIFYNPRSVYKVISNERANYLLKEVLRDLNIKPLISMHGLRHTHGSILLYRKSSYQYVSERLGHSDIQTTLRVYTHLLKELRQEDDQITIKTFEDMYNKDE